MGMVVQHNMTAANANRNLGVTCGNLAKSTEKLSSGYKINRAGDNAAGLAISEKMRGQIRGLDKASANAEDGISMIQTAEGALTETHSILQRMRELAVQSSSDTNTDDDRTQIQNEIDQLTQEVDRIATTTEFNTKKLLDGSRKGSVSEKDGTAKVDSTFANSTVSATITTDNTGKTAYTDAIRIEFTADFTEGQSTKSTGKFTETDMQTALGTTTNGDEDTAKLTSANIASQLANAKTTLTSKQAVVLSAKADYQSAMLTVENKITAALNGSKNVDTNDSNLKDGITEDHLREVVNTLIDVYGKADKNDGTAVTMDATAKALSDFTSCFGDTLKAGTGKDLLEAITKSDKSGAADKLAILYKAQSDLETAQKNVDILSNDKLVAAYIEKAEANVELTAATGGSEGKAAAQKHVNNATKTWNELNKGQSVLDVKDLFGSSSDTTKFEISSQVDSDNNLTINLKNKSGDDTVITIANADKIKAGDVVTITAKEMVETEQAATGKEAFRLQVGANAGQEVALGINSMKAKDLNIVQTKEGVEGKALDVTTQAGASLAIQAYDMAIQSVSTERAKMGAMQNRLEHTIANLDTSSENLQSAESSLRDTDMAEEMTRFSKNNILQQAGQSMLAQANQSTQGVLSLLG